MGKPHCIISPTKTKLHSSINMINPNISTTVTNLHSKLHSTMQLKKDIYKCANCWLKKGAMLLIMIPIIRLQSNMPGGRGIIK